MARKDRVSETPATALLKAYGVEFSEHPYDYLEHGGAMHSASELGMDPFAVVKTLIMQDQDARPLVVLMHGNRKVSTKNLARQIGAKSVEPCAPEVSGRGHIALWNPPPDAGLHRAIHPGPASHLHQRRTSGLSGGAGAASLCATAGRHACGLRAGRISAWLRRTGAVDSKIQRGSSWILSCPSLPRWWRIWWVPCRLR